MTLGFAAAGVPYRIGSSVGRCSAPRRRASERGSKRCSNRRPKRRSERARLEEWFDTSIVHPIEDFQDPKQEWRRLFSELLGTFFLVLVAAGGGMMGQAFPDTISRTAAVTAPGLMVMAIILFMGKVSGAHLNPAVSLAFAARGDFPWRRVPGYIVVQLGGATLAALFLRAVIDVSAKYGSNYPASGYSNMAAFWMELILTLGLVSVILGTASGAQNIGIVGAFGVGGYIALGGLVGQPDLGHVDEPGAHIRSGSRGTRLDGVLGVCRRSGRRCGGGGSLCLRVARLRRRQGRFGCGARGAVHRGERTRQGLIGGAPRGGARQAGAIGPEHPRVR